MTAKQELHIIVHGGIVKDCAEKSPHAKKAWDNIRKIMDTKECLHIGNPYIPHPDMPPASDNLTVLVCGAMTTNCVEKQWSCLSDLDYNVRRNFDACYEQSFGL
jgi:hypothetical protein